MKIHANSAIIALFPGQYMRVEWTQPWACDFVDAMKREMERRRTGAEGGFVFALDDDAVHVDLRTLIGWYVIETSRDELSIATMRAQKEMLDIQMRQLREGDTWKDDDDEPS